MRTSRFAELSILFCAGPNISDIDDSLVWYLCTREKIDAYKIVDPILLRLVRYESVSVDHNIP